MVIMCLTFYKDTILQHRPFPFLFLTTILRSNNTISNFNLNLFNYLNSIKLFLSVSIFSFHMNEIIQKS